MKTLNTSTINKIQNLETIQHFINSSDIVVLAHGTYDLIHIGHIEYLEEAKKLGTKLVVTLTADKWVKKGLNRPKFDKNIRAKVLASLAIIDYVCIINDESAIPAIQIIQPKIYAKGIEFASNPNDTLIKEMNEVEKYGGTTVFIDHKHKQSSSGLINAMTYGPETIELLNKIKLTDFKNLFEEFKKLDITILGETIKDIYTYVTTIGKSSKYPTLVGEIKSKIFSIGGAFAVAKQADELVNNIRFISTRQNSKTLSHKCQTFTINKYIEKERYIDNYYHSRLYEIYYGDFNTLDKTEQEYLEVILRDTSKMAPLFILDYGHGLINNLDLVEFEFKAINIQSNAGNYGFNRFNKYWESNILIVDENEFRLGIGDKSTSLVTLLEKTNLWLHELFVITCGKSGSIAKHNGKIYQCPALASNVVDPIGAGDLFFLGCGLTYYLTSCPILSQFMGNIFAAHSISKVGHNIFTSDDFLMFITSLFKGLDK